MPNPLRLENVVDAYKVVLNEIIDPADKMLRVNKDARVAVLGGAIVAASVLTLTWVLGGLMGAKVADLENPLEGQQ